MKTVMGWIDKIVSSLARRKVNKDEGRPNPVDQRRGGGSASCRRSRHNERDPAAWPNAHRVGDRRDRQRRTARAGAGEG